jgi:polyisoprenoid-binding protein YceI
MIGIVVLGVAGVAVWFFAVSDVEPTTDVTAPPIETTTTTTAETATTAVAAATETTEAVTTTEPEENSGEPVLFEIGEGSIATFELDEVLRGEPTHVTGTSDIVLGQIQVDPSDLGNTQIGTILVNARSFSTGTSFRDRAVRGPILDTQAFEFIEFAPASVDGLSGAAAVGDTLTFSVPGDLTIRDITQPVTFDVEATWTEEARLEGTATANTSRSDFELVIPNAPGVADVTEEVLITLEFVATAG